MIVGYTHVQPEQFEASQPLRQPRGWAAQLILLFSDDLLLHESADDLRPRRRSMLAFANVPPSWQTCAEELGASLENDPHILWRWLNTRTLKPTRIGQVQFLWLTWRSKCPTKARSSWLIWLASFDRQQKSEVTSSNSHCWWDVLSECGPCDRLRPFDIWLSHFVSA
jgi:hypothetical protein